LLTFTTTGTKKVESESRNTGSIAMRQETVSDYTSLKGTRVEDVSIAAVRKLRDLSRKSKSHEDQVKLIVGLIIDSITFAPQNKCFVY
jgi:hypothetical protein